MQLTTAPRRFIQIDEEGYFMMDGLRVADADSGRSWLAQLKIDDVGRAVTVLTDEPVIVEYFDEPFVALDLEKKSLDEWQVTMPYGHTDLFSPENLTLDEWDRFHGRTIKGVPFVLSRSAQDRFFNLLDEFDDDAIVIEGKRFETKPWLQENLDANQESWWSGIYRSEEPRWDLNAPAVALTTLVPKLKLPRLRVLVPGAGTGNDAAWFAQQGHIVTAFDFSPEAVSRASERYANIPNLKFIQADAFKLPQSMMQSFDLVFEQALYCAVTPEKRADLVKVWRQVLTDQGHLMGVFALMDKPFGPPFGTSEWEIRQRLQKNFRPLYWNRLRDSIPRRLGRELFIYAQKLKSF